MKSAQVLIVGGGPVGLTLAIELGQQGVRCLLIDKRPDIGRLPKMERCNARTMENFRRAGLADTIRSAGLPSNLPMDVFICVESVARPALVHHPYPSVDELKEHGRHVNDGSMPLEPYQLISQYSLEPVLRRAAEQLDGVEVSFGAELLDLEQRHDHVLARIQVGHAVEEVATDYLVGCDGGNSTVRSHLRIELRGESLLEMQQALFYCDDLYERIPAGKGRHYHIADDKASFLIVQDDTKHFSLHATGVEPEQMPELFESVVGIPITYETLYIGSWRQRLMVADRYRDGRVFLAGDAAHLVIPTGGLGMNTGAGDAVDLAWKLAAVLHGWGAPALLDTYEIERRQIGIRNVAASRRAASGRRNWRAAWSPEIAADGPEGDAARARLAAVADREQRWSNDLYGIELGYRYQRSPIIVEEPGAGPDPESFDYHPTTWPGARLPHIWLDDGTALHDKLDRGYHLLTVGGDEAGPKGVAELAAAFSSIGAPFRNVPVHSEAAVKVFDGYRSILVRPDLHVVWRGDSLPADVDGLAALATGFGPLPGLRSGEARGDAGDN